MSEQSVIWPYFPWKCNYSLKQNATQIKTPEVRSNYEPCGPSISCYDASAVYPEMAVSVSDLILDLNAACVCVF